MTLMVPEIRRGRKRAGCATLEHSRRAMDMPFFLLPALPAPTMLPFPDLSPFTDLPDDAPENDLDRLLDAVMRSRSEHVAAYLLDGINPNGRGRLHLGLNSKPLARRSPLAQAAFEGDLAMVNLLVQHGARPLPDEPMDPGTVAIDQRLRTLGWPAPAVQGRSFLAAVERNRFELAQQHLKSGGWDGTVGEDGRTPLHHLVAGLGLMRLKSRADERPDERLADLVPRLVAQGVNVNAIDRRGYSALHEALILFHGQRRTSDVAWHRVQVAMVSALLDAGADVNHLTPDGSPLVIALSQVQHADTVVPRLRVAGARLLYPTGAAEERLPGPFDPTRMHPGSALLGAVNTGRLDMVRQALELGEPLNRRARLFSYPGQAPFFRPMVPLERAAMLGHLDVLDHLLAAGATPSAIPSDGWMRLTLRRQELRAGTRKSAPNGRSPEDVAQGLAAQVEAIDRLEQAMLRAALIPNSADSTASLSCENPPAVRSRTRL